MFANLLEIDLFVFLPIVPGFKAFLRVLSDLVRNKNSLNQASLQRLFGTRHAIYLFTSRNVRRLKFRKLALKPVVYTKDELEDVQVPFVSLSETIYLLSFQLHREHTHLQQTAKQERKNFYAPYFPEKNYLHFWV